MVSSAGIPCVFQYYISVLTGKWYSKDISSEPLREPDDHNSACFASLFIESCVAASDKIYHWNRFTNPMIIIRYDHRTGVKQADGMMMLLNERLL